LKANSSDIRIIVGVWHLDGGVSAARDRLGTGCPHLVITTLAEALSEVHRLTVPELAVGTLTEKR